MSPNITHYSVVDYSSLNYPCQVSCLFSGPWQNDSYIELGIAFNTNLTQPRVFVKRLSHLTLRLTTLVRYISSVSQSQRQCPSLSVTSRVTVRLEISYKFWSHARLGSCISSLLLHVTPSCQNQNQNQKSSRPHKQGGGCDEPLELCLIQARIGDLFVFIIQVLIVIEVVL